MMLLTGFQSYGARAINPAEEIVKRLDGRTIGGERVSGCILPVDYRGLEPAIRQAISETTPSAVICLGLWPGAPMIRLERVAVNVADFEIADNVGEIAKEPLNVGGEAAFLSTLPLEAIQKRLLAAGIPCQLSGTAGTFLCNALMYHALKTCTVQSPPPPCGCGFIHVPYLPEQVAQLIEATKEGAKLELHQRGDVASMSLDVMVQAVELAIATTLDQR
jgi:pyroglutamyl-peptidase